MYNFPLIHTYLLTIYYTDQNCMADPNPELPYAHCDDDLSVHTSAQICTCELQSGATISLYVCIYMYVCMKDSHECVQFKYYKLYLLIYCIYLCMYV